MTDKIFNNSFYLNNHVLAAVDIETTGRLPGYHEIIQIAVVPLDAEFEPITNSLPFYVDIAPTFPERAERNAQTIHGLNLEKLQAEALDQTSSADLFCTWFEDLNLPLNKRLIPLAHNWAFESPFLKHWLGIATNDEIWMGTARDSMVYANGINDWYGTRGELIPFYRVSLVSLCNKLKVKLKGKAHDALSDALACTEVYKILLRDYPIR